MIIAIGKTMSIFCACNVYQIVNCYSATNSEGTVTTGGTSRVNTLAILIDHGLCKVGGPHRKVG